MALFGWKLINTSKDIYEKQSEDHIPSILCQFCGRKIPLPAMKTKPDKVQSLQENELASKGPITRSETFVLNLIEEHKYFCKWCPNLYSKKQGGWSIALEMIRYKGYTNNPVEDENNATECFEAANKLSITEEQTKFKLDILSTVQDLKSIKEKTLKRYQDILKVVENLNIEIEVSHNNGLNNKVKEKNVEEEIEHEKPSIEQAAKELGIDTDPVKKLKTEKIDD